MEDGLDLREFAAGVWVAHAPVRIVGTRLTSAMSVVRLGDGSLLVHSPLALTAQRRARVESLGHVAHLYAPNAFHHLRLGEWAAAYPDARVHAPQALLKKRPDLRIDRVHGSAPEPAFAGLIDELYIEGCRLEETVLFLPATRTAIVTDLVHNIGRPDGGWTKFYAQSMGFYDRVALSRMLRWTAFSNRADARKSLDALLALPIEKLVVGHGTPLNAAGREALAAAYDWLPKR